MSVIAPLIIIDTVMIFAIVTLHGEFTVRWSTPLAVAPGGLSRAADEHPRWHHRQRGPARHPGRLALLAGEPDLGDQCLPDQFRQFPAPRRPPGRLARAQARLYRRAGAVHRGFRPVR